MNDTPDSIKNFFKHIFIKVFSTIYFGHIGFELLQHQENFNWSTEWNQVTLECVFSSSLLLLQNCKYFKKYIEKSHEELATIWDILLFTNTT